MSVADLAELLELLEGRQAEAVAGELGLLVTFENHARNEGAFGEGDDVERGLAQDLGGDEAADGGLAGGGLPERPEQACQRCSAARDRLETAQAIDGPQARVW